MFAYHSTADGAPAGTTPPRSRSPRAFSILETALATIIVGLTVLAIVRLITAVTQQNFYAQKTVTAEMLANNIRELTAGVPFNDPASGTHLGPNVGQSTLALFNDVQDFDGFVANPPVDAQRQVISSLPDWQQSVTITHVSPSNYRLSDSLPTDSACNLDRVRVTVSYRPLGTSTWIPIVSMEWLKARL